MQKVRPVESYETHRRSKQATILALLRERIVRGQYPVNSQLPTHVHLAEEFATSPVTIQRVLDRLVFEGWAVSRPRQGTFVSSRPPHLGSYGLVLSEQADDAEHPSRSRFYETCILEATLQNSSGNGRRFSVYTGIDPHVDTEDFCRLRGDILSRRLGGLILLDPLLSSETPLLIESNIPRVGIWDGPRPDMPVVNPDQRAWFVAATEALHRFERRRPALMFGSQVERRFVAEVRQQMIESGFEVRLEHMVGVDPRYPHWARTVTALLFRGTEPPDSLVIADDHLVEHATAGLVDCRIQVPQEVQVIAHANFPRVTPAVVPACRLGTDVRQLIETCVSIIDRQIAGETVEAVTPLKPVFADSIVQHQV